jgi:hypothetical protein
MTPDQEAQHPDIARAARDQLPRSYLLYGFTTLIDLISTPQDMARWKSRDIVPDTYFCGGAALMDGYSMNYTPKPQRYQGWPYMLIEPASRAPDGIDPAMHTPQAVVSRMKADGAICVKTFFERGFGAVRDLPVPKLETIREVVKSAHAAGLPVLMHANSDEAHRFGLDAGVDIMAHGLWNWSQEHSTTSEATPGIKKILDDELAQNVGWQPTMQVLYGIRDIFSTSFLSDPRLTRVLPSNLIDWYRSPEGQWFRMVVSQDMKLPANANLASSRVSSVRNWPGQIVATRDSVRCRTTRPYLVCNRYAERPHLRQSTWAEWVVGDASAHRCGRNSGADLQVRDADERAGTEAGSGHRHGPGWETRQFAATPTGSDEDDRRLCRDCESDTQRPGIGPIRTGGERSALRSGAWGVREVAPYCACG